MVLCQSASPSSISSSFSSSPAVNSTLIISEKYSFMRSVVTIPSSVGFKSFFSLTTYPRAIIVVIIGAYVLGLPIPISSRVFIRDASEYLAGGSVKCCSGFNSEHCSFSPSVSIGIFLTESSSFSETYRSSNPLKHILLPLALKI